MKCEHEWQEQVSEIEATVIYNGNGEYVEGFGWTRVFVPLELPKEYKCNKCHSLKKGEVIFPPLPKPKNGFKVAPNGSRIV